MHCSTAHVLHGSGAVAWEMLCGVVDRSMVADSHVDSTTTLGIGRGVVDTHSLIEITQVA